MSPAGEDGDGGDEKPPSNVVQFRKFSHDPEEAAARARMIVSYRLSGMSYPAIGKEIGYSASRVYAIFTEAITLTSDEVAQARTLEAMRYDRMTAAVWPGVLSGDVGAVSAALRISAQRSKLLGLDAPTKVEITPAPLEVQQLVGEILSITGENSDIVDADVIEDDVLDGDPEHDPTAAHPLDDDYEW